MKQVFISHQPIELYKILKLEGMARSGGEAKMFISDEQVLVNNEIETRKRKKINEGDIIQLFDEIIQVSLGK